MDRASAWGAFLTLHGDGVMSLLFLAPSRETYEGETARLQAAGVGVLQRGVFPSGGQTVDYIYLDTQPQGKYVLGLMCGSQFTPPVISSATPSSVRVTQFAFVVNSLPPVSAYWKRLGFPEFEVTHPVLTNLFYQGRSARYEQDLGWQRHGSIPFEWCVPPESSATVYAEYLKTHGEGLQHIAFEVSDMDQAIACYKQLGFETVQGGGWGEDGKPGSGRFGYVDTDRAGGLTIELLWNYRKK
jgi:methylmalonyl-CoA/ethylmalonyl-CoA epimerase